MKSERELNLCTLVLEQCLTNKPNSEVSAREKEFIDGAIRAFKNFDFFTNHTTSNDFYAEFDNSSFPVVVNALLKYDNSGREALSIVKSILKVTDEYFHNKLNKENQDYQKAIDFLKNVNTMYRQKASNNMSPESMGHNVF